jgi:hypothetical protein
MLSTQLVSLLFKHKLSHSFPAQNLYVLRPMASCYAILLLIILCFYAIEAHQLHSAKLIVNASNSLGKQIPNTFMGVFFEVSYEQL